MDKLIVYTDADGSVNVMTLSDRWVGTFSSEDEAIQEAIARYVPPDAGEVAVVDKADFPNDRLFRPAWRLVSGAVVEDETLARNVARERLENLKLLKAKELLEREMLGEQISAERAALQAFDSQSVVAGKTVAQLRADDVRNPAALRRRNP